MEIDLGIGFFKPKMGGTDLAEGEAHPVSGQARIPGVEFTSLFDSPPAEPSVDPGPLPDLLAAEGPAIPIEVASSLPGSSGQIPEAPATAIGTPITVLTPAAEVPVVQPGLPPNPRPAQPLVHLWGNATIPSTPSPEVKPGPAAPAFEARFLSGPPQAHATEPTNGTDPKVPVPALALPLESPRPPAPAGPDPALQIPEIQTAPTEPKSNAHTQRFEYPPAPTQPLPAESRAAPVAPANTAPVMPVFTAMANPAPLGGTSDESAALHEIPVSVRIDRPMLDNLPATLPANRTAPPVSTQLTEQIQLQLSKPGQQVIELKLDPPELGRVTIQLTTHDQTVAALVSSDRPETADLMRRHADLLQSALQKSGFSQADLSFEQGPQQDGKQSDAPHYHLLSSEDPPSAGTPPKTAPAPDGGLDIRL